MATIFVWVKHGFFCQRSSPGVCDVSSAAISEKDDEDGGEDGTIVVTVALLVTAGEWALGMEEDGGERSGGTNEMGGDEDDITQMTCFL